MNIIRIDESKAYKIASLVAEFRVALRSYKGIESQADIEAGKEEILEFLNSGYPVFAVEDEGVLAGYIVCKIEEPCLWVEHIYVREDYRRKGAATILFSKAEGMAEAMGGETVFNYVHPNNEGMIHFLRSKGYTVLNMIEIRRPYQGEKLASTIQVGNNDFDY